MLILSSRVQEQTIRFFLQYMTKPPRHELVGSDSLYSGRRCSLSMVTVHGMSLLPSSALTWLSISCLYSDTASSMTAYRIDSSLSRHLNVTFGSINLISPCTSNCFNRAEYSDLFEAILSCIAFLASPLRLSTISLVFCILVMRTLFYSALLSILRLISAIFKSLLNCS